MKDQPSETSFWTGTSGRNGLLCRKLAHSDHIYALNTNRDMVACLSAAAGKNVLSIGAYSWYYYLYCNGIVPSKITCVNTSSAELALGRTVSVSVENGVVDFVRMDAGRLAFPDDTFDFVFGTSILHHLDLSLAIPGIHRVLKKNGNIFFIEPLGVNPLGKVVRALTPHARTNSEKPFDAEDLKMVKEFFGAEFRFQQLATVPLGFISRFFFRKPVNVLTRSGYALDSFLLKTVPGIGLQYRKVIITGKK